MAGTQNDGVAIVGIGCRLPGGAKDADGVWEFLSRGGDGTRAVPQGRWTSNLTDAPLRGGFIEDIDLFDADLFSISPREAEQMDPQQRLLLLASWEAMEDAGVSPSALSGTRTGVFVGISNVDYHRMVFRNPNRLTPHSGTGTALSIAAARISYVFNLKGPSLIIDTACSSSLVALHYACRSLASGECDRALVGGVSLMLNEEVSACHAKSRMLAPDGRCKPFDAAADGFGRGEGCGVVMLRRLQDALVSGDRIIAVVLGSAVNHDGLSNGLTAPNGLAQQDVIRLALEDAGIEADEVGYVEAHGTGTPLGDPIEMRALKSVYVAGHPEREALWVGSIKANVGHLEAAAGIAGLIKASLSVQRGAIPPLPHFYSLNPYVDLADGLIRLPSKLETWMPRGGARRVAGISAFSFGGTNCHVLLAQAPQIAQAVKVTAPGPYVLKLAARSSSALSAMASAWVSALTALSSDNTAAFCTATNRSRARLPETATIIGADKEELLAGLQALANGGENLALHRGPHPTDSEQGDRPLVDANKCRWVPVPKYPFQLVRYWFEADSESESESDGLPVQPEALARYHVVWERCKLAHTKEHSRMAWLVLGTDDAVADDLAERLRRHGESVYRLHNHTIDTVSPIEQKALQDWVTGNGALLLNLVHVFPTLSQSWHSLDADVVANTVDMQLSHLLNTWEHVVEKAHNRPLRLWCVTRSATANRQSGVADPVSASLAGLARTLRLEQPVLWGGLIDLDSHAEPIMQGLFHTLVARRSMAAEDQYAIDSDGVWVPRLACVPWTSPALVKTSIRADRTYMVTGGLGGIGKQVVSWLLRQGAGHVVTLGRREAPAGWLPPCDATRWSHQCGSVSDPLFLDTCFTELGRSLPTIGGVFHAAGVVGEPTLAHEMDTAAWSEVLEPKVRGTLYLHRKLSALAGPVPFLVLFSSIASVWGSATQSVYAAANAAMDALASHSLGGPRTVSIHWGPWAGSGMAAEEQRQRLLEARGVFPLRVEEALAELEVALNTPDWKPTICARIKWDRFVPGFSAVGADAFFQRLATPASGSLDAGPDRGHLWATLQRQGASKRSTLLEEFISEAVKKVLKLPIEVPLDKRRGFVELGMDSLMAVDLRKQLEEGLDIEIQTTVAFDYPTVTRLVDHLLERLSPPSPTTPTASQPDSPRHTSVVVQAQSEEELEAMLLSKLDAIGG